MLKVSRFTMQRAPSVPNCEFWKRVEGLRSSRIQCSLCPRRCLLKNNQRGFCYVRRNVNDSMELTAYGRSSGFCIDPIEKKPLNHFLPGSSILSFGTVGCNLGCKFCQNWDISKAMSDERLQDHVPPEAVSMAAKYSRCESVAMTYNEPIIFYEYGRDIAVQCRKAGIKTVAVTAGYLTDEARAAFFDCFDGANVDLKAFDEEFYREMCKAKLQPVLDTLAYLAKLKREKEVWFEVTNLVIPGKNDSVREIEAMCKWILDNCGPFVPLHFTAFHPSFQLMDVPRTPHSTLQLCRSIASRVGLKYVYIGNVYDEEGEKTKCHHCSYPLIVRSYYALQHYAITGQGRCPKCDTRIPGIFPTRVPEHCSQNFRRPTRVNMRPFVKSENSVASFLSQFR